MPTPSTPLTPTRPVPGRSPGRAAGRPSPRQLAAEAGQGTVEYVGLLLLMATVLAGVVAAAGSLGGTDKIGKQVVTKIGESIDKTSKAPAKP